MNIEDLIQSLPSREDLAHAVGMQTRSHSMLGGSTDILPTLGIFGTGMLFGAGLALLFAPKSGSDMRRDLSEKAQHWGEQAQDMAEEYTGQKDYASHSTSAQKSHTTPGQSAETHRPYSGTGSRNI